MCQVLPVIFKLFLYFTRGTFPESFFVSMFTRIRACEQLQEFCEHKQARAHQIFASNSNKD